MSIFIHCVTDLQFGHIDRIIRETGKDFEDREHIIYVNAAYKDDSTVLGKLIHDFTFSDPDDMMIPEISRNANEWKNTKKGVDSMCKLVEDYVREEKNNLTNVIKKAPFGVLFCGKISVRCPC